MNRLEILEFCLSELEDVAREHITPVNFLKARAAVVDIARETRCNMPFSGGGATTFALMMNMAYLRGWIEGRICEINARQKYRRAK